MANDQLDDFNTHAATRHAELSARSDEQIERARQYAFHFFFRRMIPVKAMTPAPDWRPYVMGFNGLDVLRPGGCGGLDVICRGVIDGEPYVYPAECEEK